MSLGALILGLLPGMAFISLSKLCADRGRATYVATGQRSALFYLAFFLFFAGVVLIVLGVGLSLSHGNR